jgi:putative membrane protein
MSNKPRSFDLPAEPQPATSQASTPSRAFEIDFPADALALEQDEPQATREPKPASKRRLLARLGWGAFAGFVGLLFWFWLERLVLDLIAGNRMLGFTALSLLAIAGFAALIWMMREMLAIQRLARIDRLRQDAVSARESRLSAEAKTVVKALIGLYQDKPELARARLEQAENLDTVIDADDRLAMAERALLAPLDRQARIIVAESARRVSLVTALSPRAVIDLLFVGAEALRLTRRLSRLYGGRPGFFASWRLIRAVLGHLAITGGIAVGSDLASQVLGHGLAARISTKLGEGVLNGILTARVGLAAIAACRPLPFWVEDAPKVSDVAGSLLTRKEDKA